MTGNNIRNNFQKTNDISDLTGNRVSFLYMGLFHLTDVKQNEYFINISDEILFSGVLKERKSDDHLIIRLSEFGVGGLEDLQGGLMTYNPKGSGDEYNSADFQKNCLLSSMNYPGTVNNYSFEWKDVPVERKDNIAVVTEKYARNLKKIL